MGGVVVSGGLVVLGSLTLPGVRRSVGYARRFLRDLVPAAHPRLDDLVTVTSETVTNAIVHTDSGDGGRVTISLLAGGDLYRLEVADDGAGGRRPHPRAEAGAESGRGLWLVEALSDGWGFRADGARTVVWAEFRAGGNSSGNTDRGLSECSRTLVPAAFEGGDR
ncbi:ATP-binding protein [Actinomadura livida]|uniref:ATP-binding protein n=1 Tax=Actinomadura livida TaxID=79909 RepID=UPI001E4FB060|nr:ATP-binding protein [Actinomadura livida]